MASSMGGPHNDYRFCCGHATEPKARARDRLQQPAVGQLMKGVLHHSGYVV